MATVSDHAAMSEAEARYLDRVLEDCAELLGPGVDIDGIDVLEDVGAVLRLRYHLGAVAWTSEGHGATLVAAHGALRGRLVLDRIRVSTVALYRAGRQAEPGARTRAAPEAVSRRTASRPRPWRPPP